MKLKNIDHKIGIYEKAINDRFDWDDKLAIAKAAGFDFIEISIDESQHRIDRLNWSNQKIYALLQLCWKHQMFFNSLCLSANRKFPLGSKDLQIQQQGLTLIYKAIVFAKKLGIRIIQLAGYDEYYHPSDLETKAIFTKNMHKVSQWAQQHSVFLAFESMDTFFMGSLVRIYNFLNQFQNPWLGIYPDIGNLYQFSGLNFSDEIFLAHNQIVAFHFKDTLPNQFKNLEFGKGNVPFVSCLQAILTIHFKGPFVLEMWNENKFDQTKQANITTLQQAYYFFYQTYEQARF